MAISTRNAAKASICLLALSAPALPALGQTYRHAPAGGGGPLITAPSLPSVEGLTSLVRSGDTQAAPHHYQSPHAPPAAAPPARPLSVYGPRRLPAPAGVDPSGVPSHLARNTWSRHPSATPNVPVPYENYAPSSQYAPYSSVPDGFAQNGAAPVSSAEYYAMRPARTLNGERAGRRDSARPAAPGDGAALPTTARKSAAEWFTGTHDETLAYRDAIPRSSGTPPHRQGDAVAQRRLASAPARFQPAGSVEPMPEAENPRRDTIQLASYAQTGRRRAAPPAIQPPVPPASPRVPSATGRPASRDRPRPARRARGMVRPASAASAPPAVPSAPPASLPPRSGWNSPRLSMMLTDAARALGNQEFVLAEQILDEARALAPRDARPEALRARLYEMEGQWDQAVEAFDRLIILEPRMTTWRLARARASFQLGQYAKAIADYRTVEATSARLGLNDYTLLCEAAFRLGDAATVAHSLEMIESINPAPHPRSELIRGLIAFHAGDEAKARNTLLRASAMWPDNKALTEALRRTSAVYYEHKHNTNIAADSDKGYPRSMTSAEVSSLELVREYTPALPKKKAPPIIRTTDGEKPPETSRIETPDGPTQLGAVFARPSPPNRSQTGDPQPGRPQTIGHWRREAPSAAGTVITANHIVVQPSGAIGFE